MNPIVPDAECWLPVVGFEGLYEVSDQGRVRSLPRVIVRSNGTSQSVRGRLLAQGITRNPYPEVRLQVARGKQRAYPVHLLVLKAFVGPRPAGLKACHHDDVPTNNALTNLRWDTNRANSLDAVRNGRHPKARLTACPVGHRYTPENTMLHVHKNGQTHRRCRTCNREQHRIRSARYRARQKAAA